MNIVTYLASLGVNPTKQSGHDLFYLSPLHTEHNASFHVTIGKELWYDFGLGVGGGLAELKERLTEIGTIVADNISNLSYVMPIPAQPLEPGIVLTSAGPITDRRLQQYLHSRGIDSAVAEKYCKEVHYHFTRTGKDGFAIGFPNDGGGYEYRNKLLKGCIGGKDISSFHRPSSLTCCIYEGFMDFLSALTLPLSAGLVEPDSDYIVLNSTVNARRAIEALAKYSRIHLYLDNDVAGDSATRQIMEFCPAVEDRRHLFAEWKDINDFLQQRNTASNQ